ncbi:hypothetical protein [Streptomyces sp. NBC_00448]|uniref:hypothetical protein n=1 Tax=Streptomyces sp. NBC_00448 TaxID=2903652 RepID=UPI002E1A77B3
MAKTTVKSVDGKVYVNGKEVPGARLNKDCPKPPALPRGTAGKGGASSMSSSGGVLSVERQGSGVAVKGEPGGDEAGLTTSSVAG